MDKGGRIIAHDWSGSSSRLYILSAIISNNWSCILALTIGFLHLLCLRFRIQFSSCFAKLWMIWSRLLIMKCPAGLWESPFWYLYNIRYDFGHINLRFISQYVQFAGKLPFGMSKYALIFASPLIKPKYLLNSLAHFL